MKMYGWRPKRVLSLTSPTVLAPRPAPLLAERAHQNGMDQPGQSLCSRKAAHQKESGEGC